MDRGVFAWLPLLLFAPACTAMPVAAPRAGSGAPAVAPADSPPPADWIRPQRVIPWGRYRLAPPGEEPDYEYDPERGEYRFPQEKRNGRPDVFVPEVLPEPRCPDDAEPSPTWDGA